MRHVQRTSASGSKLLENSSLANKVEVMIYFAFIKTIRLSMFICCPYYYLKVEIRKETCYEAYLIVIL